MYSWNLLTIYRNRWHFHTIIITDSLPILKYTIRKLVASYDHESAAIKQVKADVLAMLEFMLVDSWAIKIHLLLDPSINDLIILV